MMVRVVALFVLLPALAVMAMPYQGDSFDTEAPSVNLARAIYVRDADLATSTELLRHLVARSGHAGGSNTGGGGEVAQLQATYRQNLTRHQQLMAQVAQLPNGNTPAQRIQWGTQKTRMFEEANRCKAAYEAAARQLQALGARVPGQ
ncbi:hypothetical protein OC834_005630 [Tilletia horrida]|nr:hypothetical protein OC834_005630 [Tilletia horrida]